MRPALVFVVALASASGASAQVVQDRYGPPRAQAVMLAALNGRPAVATYDGPLLSWAHKRTASAVASFAAPGAPVSAVAPAPQPLPAPSAPRPPSGPRPDTFYAPPNAPQPRPVLGPDLSRAQPGPQVAFRPAPAPRQVAAAPPATPPAIGAAPRYYSLHREYGLTPDAPPEPPAHPGYVLIGPPDAPKPSADDGDDRKPLIDRGTF